MPAQQSKQNDLEEQHQYAIDFVRSQYPEFLEEHAAMRQVLSEAREQLDRLRRGQRVPDVELRSLIWRIEDTVGR